MLIWLCLFSPSRFLTLLQHQPRALALEPFDRGQTRQISSRRRHIFFLATDNRGSPPSTLEPGPHVAGCMSLCAEIHSSPPLLVPITHPFAVAVDVDHLAT